MAVHGDVVGLSRAERFAAAERRIGRVTHVLDELVSVPGTPIKVGLDPVIGVIPIAGDALAALVGVWVILEASRFGIPRVVLGRMVANLVVDLGIGAIPLIGDAYDLFFRSNSRNLELFRRHALEPGASTRGEQAFFIGLLVLAIGLLWLLATFIGLLGSVRL
jgi:Domain of unknown function (DUF4112)